MKKFIEEFKAFALRGNVVDMAIGVLIGGAFGALVGSFTDNIITPILNCIGGGVEFGWAIPLIGEQKLLIGNFVSAVINFLIYALVIFMVMKSMNKLAELGKKKEEEAPAAEQAPDPNVVLLTEIRDLLKEKQ
ncbi:MAG: large conductance mechanosensitive channel protein MscL [Bacillota bacterium]|nr:large conductance mechanosensitive channel protein MscL [Bacillota bacterium]